MFMRFFCLTILLVVSPFVNSFSQRHDLNTRIDSVNATCGNNNAEIHIVIVDGVGPYQYSLDYGNHWQNTSDFIGLAPGDYYPTSKDLTTGIKNIIKVSLMSGCLTANALVKNATCSINNGTITITAVQTELLLTDIQLMEIIFSHQMSSKIFLRETIPLQ